MFDFEYFSWQLLKAVFTFYKKPALVQSFHKEVPHGVC